jgi:hypothetical protein
VQRDKILPIVVLGPFVEAGARPAEHHAVLLSVAGEIEELMARRPRLSEAGEPGDLSNCFEARRDRRLIADEVECQWADISIVVPDVVIGSEDALQTFAVEVQPLELRAVELWRKA